MKREPRSIFVTFGRCLKLLCPVCGRASIVQRPFHLKHDCDSCRAVFKREEGFFVGAIMANVVATELFILISYMFCLLFMRLGDQTMLTILIAIAIAFPVAFYHHAWALWLGLDQLIEGLPQSAQNSHQSASRNR